MPKLQLKKEYEKYPAYKDSGVEWLGKIPKGWETATSRRLFTTYKERVGSKFGDYKILSLTLHGVIPRVMDGSGKNPAEYDTYQAFKKNDLVFCLFDYDVTPRTIGYVEEGGMMTGAYTRLVPKIEVYSKYFYYYFLSLDYTKELLHLCTGLRNSLSKPIFWAMKSSLPSYNEQKKIANYLDEKTAIIDQIIEKKQKLIELLREKRTVVINNAVTKGLDPKVELVESGIEWVGKIPKGWGLIDLGKIVEYEQPGMYIATDIEEDYEEGMTQVLTAGKGFIIGYTKEKYGIFSKLPVIIFDDFTTSKQFVCLPFKVRSSALKILKNCDNSRNDIRYIFRCMEVLDFQTLEHNRHWIAMYRHENIPWPKLQMQKAVADYLENKDIVFGSAISRIENTIELLNEFKSSLISNVVTGKVKV
jgi:type I restriction enzyme S subunit